MHDPGDECDNSCCTELEVPELDLGLAELGVEKFVDALVPPDEEIFS